MKIIGIGNANKLIFEGTRDEIANLVGFYYEGAKGCPDLKVGVEVRIGDMYKQLRGLADRQDKLKSVAGDLRLLADLLELKQPLIYPPPPPPRPEREEEA